MSSVRFYYFSYNHQSAAIHLHHTWTYMILLIRQMNLNKLFMSTIMSGDQISIGLKGWNPLRLSPQKCINIYHVSKRNVRDVVVA